MFVRSEFSRGNFQQISLTRPWSVRIEFGRVVRSKLFDLLEVIDDYFERTIDLRRILLDWIRWRSALCSRLWLQNINFLLILTEWDLGVSWLDLESFGGSLQFWIRVYWWGLERGLESKLPLVHQWRGLKWSRRGELERLHTHERLGIRPESAVRAGLGSRGDQGLRLSQKLESPLSRLFFLCSRNEGLGSDPGFIGLVEVRISILRLSFRLVSLIECNKGLGRRVVGLWVRLLVVGVGLGEGR